MPPLKLIPKFVAVSAQAELAYQANFYIQVMHSLLNLLVGVLGVWVLFSQVQSLRGWTFASTLAILGVYLVVTALKNLFIGPSLDSLAGLEGDVMQGRFDFTLLKPVNTQFLVSFRSWRLFSLFDLLLGVGVLGAAVGRMEQSVGFGQALAFLATLFAGIAILYAILLVFTALVFWSPGFLFTWVFDGVFQMARYPVGIYPGWLRLVLTWIVPVGIITTIPAQALSGQLSPLMLGGILGLAAAFVWGASALFRLGLTRYASASS